MQQIINPLQAKLQAGIKAGLFCSEGRIKVKFNRLQKAFEKYERLALEKQKLIREQTHGGN